MSSGLVCDHVASAHADGRDLLEPGQYLLREELDALLGLGMRHKARPPDHHQMAKAADLVVKIHDLLVDGVRAAGEQEPARHRLLCVEADECCGVPTGRGGGLCSVRRL